MQKTLELEEEVGKIPLLKAQVEEYKKQIISLKSEGATMSEKEIKKQMEAHQLNEQIQQLNTVIDFINVFVLHSLVLTLEHHVSPFRSVTCISLR